MFVAALAWSADLPCPIRLSDLMSFVDQIGIQSCPMQAGARFVPGEDLLGIAVEGSGLGVECALPQSGGHNAA